MIKIMCNAFKAIRDKYRAARDPVGFARSLGVRVGKGVRFYGVSRGMFGSEPWMISIGDNCYITANVQFINHDGGTLILRQFEPTLEWTAPISIGNDVYIGVRSIILPNVRIGSRCVIGAGSIVTRDVPDNSVYAGVPARYICSIDDYFEKLKNKSLECGHMSPSDKAEEIKRIYREKGWFESSGK